MNKEDFIKIWELKQEKYLLANTTVINYNHFTSLSRIIYDLEEEIKKLEQREN